MTTNLLFYSRFVKSLQYIFNLVRKIWKDQTDIDRIQQQQNQLEADKLREEQLAVIEETMLEKLKLAEEIDTTEVGFSDLIIISTYNLVHKGFVIIQP